LYFRLNATLNEEISDNELVHAFEFEQVEQQHYEVVDTTENERDGYVIEHLSNGSQCFDRLIDLNSEYTIPIWKKKEDTKIKILTQLKWSWSDIHSYQRAMETAVSFREKRFLNR